MLLLDKPAHVTPELIVPTWYAEKIAFQKKVIAKLKHRDMMAKNPAYRYEYEQKLKDTKPVFYMDRSTPHRPVLIVGGKGMWYQDMVEKAQRLKEKPNPANDPEMMSKRNVKEDMSVAIDRRQRNERGTRVFHISNNPLGGEK